MPIPRLLLALLMLAASSGAAHAQAARSRALPSAAPAIVAAADTAFAARPLPERDARWSTARHTWTGALIGAAAGLAAFGLQADDECRSGESMCGLLIPAFVVTGTAAGGLIGYVIGRTRH